MNDNQQSAESQLPVEQDAAVAPSAGDLEQRLAQAEAQAAEYLDSWRRSVADLSNARKRMQREHEDFARSAAERVLDKLLPVLDDMDRAFTVVPEDQVESEWVNGFRMIHRKLQGVLEAEGLTPIPAVGEHFNPALHHAVTYEAVPGFADGMIVAELAKGYKLRDKVLRPTMVRVAKDA